MWSGRKKEWKIDCGRELNFLLPDLIWFRHGKVRNMLICLYCVTRGNFHSTVPASLSLSHSLFLSFVVVIILNSSQSRQKSGNITYSAQEIFFFYRTSFISCFGHLFHEREWVSASSGTSNRLSQIIFPSWNSLISSFFLSLSSAAAACVCLCVVMCLHFPPVSPKKWWWWWLLCLCERQQ